MLNASTCMLNGNVGMLRCKAPGFDCNTCCLDYNDRLPDCYLYHFNYKIAGLNYGLADSQSIIARLRCGLYGSIAITYIPVG